jgi:hypothetical protein
VLQNGPLEKTPRCVEFELPFITGADHARSEVMRLEGTAAAPIAAAVFKNACSVALWSDEYGERVSSSVLDTKREALQDILTLVGNGLVVGRGHSVGSFPELAAKWLPSPDIFSTANSGISVCSAERRKTQ